MFTGIIKNLGTIAEINAQESQLGLRIACDFQDYELGESIALDGCCLTVTGFDRNSFSCLLSRETLDRTVASSYQLGQLVHLERAMQMSDRFGGHFVLGHVDGVGTVTQLEQAASCLQVKIELPLQAKPYLLEKGSIAVDGVSLTINSIHQYAQNMQIELMLIPHTLEKTHFHDLKIGQKLNLEYDYLAKIVHSRFQ